MATFEQAVVAMEPERDLELFIDRNRNPDMTHSVSITARLGSCLEAALLILTPAGGQFSSALTLLDWDAQRRRRIPTPSQE